MCLFSVDVARVKVKKGEKVRVESGHAVSQRILAPMEALRWEDEVAFLENVERKSMRANVLGNWNDLSCDGYRVSISVAGVNAECEGKRGVPLGENGKLFNHFALTVWYRKVGNGEFEVASVEAKPEVRESQTGLTYDMKFLEFKGGLQAVTNPTWLSRANLVVFVVNLLVLIGVCVLALESKGEETLDDVAEAGVWYMMRGDIFRPPKYVSLLALSCGIGAQVVVAFLSTGIWKYRSYGVDLEFLLKMLAIASIVRGLVSMNMFKKIGGTEWRSILGYVLGLTPAITGSAILIANVIYYFLGSTELLSFEQTLVLAGIGGISMLLASFGSFVGAKLPVSSPPFKPNLIPRQIPKPQFYQAFFNPCGGLYTFIWMLPSVGVIFALIHGMSYVILPPWFVFLGLVNAFVISSCVSITVVYAGARFENPRWWWNAFLAPASSGGFYLLYAIGYGFTLHLAGASAWILHILCHGMISLSIFVVCGFFGFSFTYMFLFRLYSSLTKAT